MSRCRLFKHFLLCFLLTLLTLCGIAQSWEVRLLYNVNLGRNKALDRPMLGVTNSVWPLAIGVPVTMTAVGFVTKDPVLKHQGLYTAATVFVNAGGTYVIKRIVNRTRPYEIYSLDNLVVEHNASFPSGHTSNSFALATSLTLATKKWYVAVPAYTWAATAGYSRLHLGVHYPSDVLAGAAMGAGSAVLLYHADRWLHKHK